MEKGTGSVDRRGAGAGRREELDQQGARGAKAAGAARQKTDWTTGADMAEFPRTDPPRAYAFAESHK